MHTADSALRGYREEGFLSTWQLERLAHNLKPLGTEVPYWSRLLDRYVHSVICVVGLLGNVLVIITYAFLQEGQVHDGRVYLLNVALSDVLFVVALPLIIINDQYNWSMGTWACKLLRGVYSVNLYSGMLLLACISTDRYVAIVQARRSFRIRVAGPGLQPGHLRRRLVCSPSACPSRPSFTTRPTVPGEERDGGHDEGPGPQFAGGRGLLPPPAGDGLLLLQHRRHAPPRPQLPEAQGRASRLGRGGVVFIICHLPYNVSLLYYTVVLFEQRECGEEDTMAMALTITETLAYLHSCLNPVLYAFVGVKFRNHFRKILEDLWCVGKEVHLRQALLSSHVRILHFQEVHGRFR
ncbi:hypothetical protein SKAU_G00189610 [Synaphobranchus kaupii]|uniref:G-protein coupled receptors family 1 profile domain-containing protein n=1 Tax=Synaphobranchus kaupii TaxID=118154 RepID=A0A9Q1IV27_SYNKA|nr:hypothetical protein SKAU_G00189610 [Synaphobranchus kaupii]